MFQILKPLEFEILPKSHKWSTIKPEPRLYHQFLLSKKSAVCFYRPYTGNNFTLVVMSTGCETDCDRSSREVQC